MAKKVSIASTLKDAGVIATMWQTNPSFQMGDVGFKDFVAFRSATEELDQQYAKQDLELTGIKAKRHEKARGLSDLITRFRSAMRANYGPDSPEYEQAGGTPLSARKAPKSAEKVKPAAASL